MSYLIDQKNKHRISPEARASMEKERSHYPRTKERQEQYPDEPEGSLVEKAKDMFNSRGNMKTGTYYVKGKKSHRDYSGLEYGSDPDLKE